MAMALHLVGLARKLLRSQFSSLSQSILLQLVLST